MIENIQTKIDETIKSLNAFMKGYQMEINFSQQNTNNEQEEQTIDVLTTKGSKSFIEQLKNE